MFRKKA